MFHLRLGAIVMTGLGANPTARTGLQRGLERLVQLRFECFQSEFNGFSHQNLTLWFHGVSTLCGNTARRPKNFPKKVREKKKYRQWRVFPSGTYTNVIAATTYIGIRNASLTTAKPVTVIKSVVNQTAKWSSGRLKPLRLCSTIRMTPPAVPRNAPRVSTPNQVQEKTGGKYSQNGLMITTPIEAKIPMCNPIH